MAAFTLIRRREELRRVEARDAWPLLVSGLALAGHFAFRVASVQRTSILASVVLVTMQPLFVAIGAWGRARAIEARLAGTASR